MKLVVPLQGVVHGRGGLLLGSLIPCVLFYFLQFYLKQRRSDESSRRPSSPSSSNLPELPQSPSRRVSVGPAQVSSLANFLAQPDDSPYYIGLERVALDRYDRLNNPNGIIQLGLSENKVIVYLFYAFLDLGCNFLVF